ncbi:MAG: CRTAC1 family protein, partial [Planctomycetia bacterium]|nr:CRTAC1 family protein [Planctomycetia bacterium]
AEAWGASAAFLDYDGDGLLDLYCCHYAIWTLETNRYCGDQSRGVRIFCNPTTVEPAPHILYHNEGNGTFRDVSGETNVGAARGRGQGVVAADFNGDGRIDLYVANDLHPNLLFLNQGGGRFAESGVESGTATDFMGKVQAGMGVDAADFNRDGRLDLFVTNYEGEHNSFFENFGDNLFQEVSRARGLAAESIPWVGWGTRLVDLDLDGWCDVVVTNGHTDDNWHEMGRDSPYEQPAGLWRNVGGRGIFAGGPAAGAYFARPHVGRGLAVADLDNDGDWDVVIVHQNAPPALLRNDCLPASERPWVRVELIGTATNRDAVGTEIRLKFADGTSRIDQIKGGGSYLSAHDMRQLLALDGESAGAALEVRWPSGRRSEIAPLTTGTTYRIVEPRQ